MTITTVVFDAYGTLFDTGSAARRAGEVPEFAGIQETWPEIAATWRQKQLHYTWLRAITGDHCDFWQVTEDALDWTLEAMDLTDPALRARLLALYRELSAFPEASTVLAGLKEAGLTTVLLSNGSRDMLDAAVTSSGLSDLLDAVLSVDAVGTFKPSPKVYDLVGVELGTSPDQVLFVSSNGWDAAGAAAYGFRTLWVNRGDEPIDRLPGKPDHMAPDLSGIAALLAHPGPPASAPIDETRFFTTADGVKLAYKDQGTGPVLLCLCGLTRNMADFDFVARDFANRARILRLDTRGRGQSGFDPDYHGYNLMREGQDALELLDHLGIAKAAILGTSRGGLIALGLGLAHKDRLTGVCLNDIGPVIEPEGLAFIGAYLGNRPGLATYEQAADVLAISTKAKFPGVPRARWRLHAERVWKEASDGLELRYDADLRRAFMEQADGAQLADIWPWFDQLAGLPLGLIRGENSDILSAQTAQEMCRRRPDMLFGEVRDRGHVPFLDEPESRRVIAAFIQRLP